MDDKALLNNGLLYFWQKLKALFAGKVDKVEGKGLSTNDYTNTEKSHNDASFVGFSVSGDVVTYSKNDGNTGTFTAPNTKNTAGSTDTSDKIFIVGAKSQGANPQTYSHDTAYVGTDGNLYSGGKKVKTAQTAVPDPAASGESTTFIDTLSQDANGNVTPTKKSVPVMGAASASAGGTKGLVPDSAAGDQAKYLRADGSWETPTNTDTKVTQAAATTTNKSFPVILGYSDAATAVTNTVNKSSTLKYNPSTKELVTGGKVDGYTLAAASAKGVDTSITDGSTSTNLPTSAAVVDYVGTKVSGLYRYKGSVATVAQLPSTGQVTGDVWDVQERGINYAWNGSAWDALGELFTVEGITNAEIDEIMAT